MARTTAPFMSLDASGTFGKTLVASRWKGRPYMRLRVIPSNPKTVAQTSNRAMMKFLAQIWASLTAPTQATWETLAAQGQYSPFNAFVSQNQSRYSTGRAPSQEYPILETSSPGGVNSLITTGGVRLVTVALDGALATNQWGILLCRELTTGFTPGPGNAIAVLPLPDGTAAQYIDTPLVPDTYFYNTVPFGVDGLYGTAGTEASATVT